MRLFDRPWKKLVFAGYALLLGAFALLLPLYLIFNDPTSPYRPAVVRLVDEICGGSPSNAEGRGIYANHDVEKGQPWRIALYDGARKHRLFFGVGGDDFRRAAMEPTYTFRIN